MFEEMKDYQRALEKIVSDNNGTCNYNDLSYSEKVVIIAIMKKYKEIVDDFMAESYPVIKTWADLDMEQVILEETEAETEMDRLFKNEFENMMNWN